MPPAPATEPRIPATTRAGWPHVGTRGCAPVESGSKCVGALHRSRGGVALARGIALDVAALQLQSEVVGDGKAKAGDGRVQAALLAEDVLRVERVQRARKGHTLKTRIGCQPIDRVPELDKAGL